MERPDHNDYYTYKAYKRDYRRWYNSVYGRGSWKRDHQLGGANIAGHGSGWRSRKNWRKGRRGGSNSKPVATDFDSYSSYRAEMRKYNRRRHGPRYLGFNKFRNNWDMGKSRRQWRWDTGRGDQKFGQWYYTDPDTGQYYEPGDKLPRFYSTRKSWQVWDNLEDIWDEYF